MATAVPSTKIFASPLRFDENWNIHPYLAKNWKISEDGLSVTLNLVENATFHDGKPVTSEDVAFTIMTSKANHPFKTMFAPVEKIDTPDAQYQADTQGRLYSPTHGFGRVNAAQAVQLAKASLGGGEPSPPHLSND